MTIRWALLLAFLVTVPAFVAAIAWWDGRAQRADARTARDRPSPARDVAAPTAAYRAPDRDRARS